MVGGEGIEPSTLSTSMRCSTTELTAQIKLKLQAQPPALLPSHPSLQELFAA